MPSVSASSSLLHKQLSHENKGSRLWAAWDGAGAFASFLCMIHCVGVPILLAAFPGLSSALPVGAIKDEAFHQVVAVIAAVLALSAFSKGYRQHHSRRVIVLGILGCALLFIAASGIEHETAWTVVGSVLLITAHLDNYRRVHAHSHAQGHAGHQH